MTEEPIQTPTDPFDTKTDSNSLLYPYNIPITGNIKAKEYLLRLDCYLNKNGVEKCLYNSKTYYNTNVFNIQLCPTKYGITDWRQDNCGDVKMPTNAQLASLTDSELSDYSIKMNEKLSRNSLPRMIKMSSCCTPLIKDMYKILLDFILNPESFPEKTGNSDTDKQNLKTFLINTYQTNPDLL